jgi:chemotaxis protein MotA
MEYITASRKSTLIGLVGCVVVLAVTALTSHQHILNLINLPGLVMVLGGTLTATLVSRPARDVLRVVKSLRTLVHDDDLDINDEMTHLLTIAYWYRAGNLAAVEQALEQVANPLLRTGAQLVIDRDPIQDIVKVMQWRIAGVQSREQGDAQILRTMATFAPVFGMLGTLFGLIQLLGTLGHVELAQIGASMSFALITTLYGLILANMIFKPLAMKMEQRIRHRLTVMNVIVEGVILLHQRRHPFLIKEALATYMLQHQGAAAVPGTLPKAA